MRLAPFFLTNLCFNKNAPQIYNNILEIPIPNPSEFLVFLFT